MAGSYVRPTKIQLAWPLPCMPLVCLLEPTPPPPCFLQLQRTPTNKHSSNEAHSCNPTSTIQARLGPQSTDQTWPSEPPKPGTNSRLMSHPTQPQRVFLANLFTLAASLFPCLPNLQLCCLPSATPCLQHVTGGCSRRRSVQSPVMHAHSLLTSYHRPMPSYCSSLVGQAWQLVNMP